MPKVITLVFGAAAFVFLCVRCLSSHPAQIQADLGNKASGVLNAAALGWAEVTADGRDLRLSGAAPDAPAGLAAEKLLRGINGVRTVDNTVQLAMAAGPQARSAPQAVDPTGSAQVSENLARAASSLASDPQLDSCQQELDALLRSRRIRFNAGQAGINSASYPLLESIAAVAARCPDARIEVAGHTDSSGAAAFNLRLSQQRADAVRSYLIAAGVNPGRLEARGYGETRPIASNDYGAGRATNRRIEFNVQGPAQ